MHKVAAVIAGLTGLAALTLLINPTLPTWTERHTPHTHRPPIELTAQQTLTQTFKFEHKKLDRVAVWLGTPLPSSGHLLVTVSSAQSKQAVTVPWSAVPPSGIVAVTLDPPLQGDFGQAGTIELKLEQTDGSLKVAYQGDSSKYVDGELHVPGTKLRGDIAFQLRYQRAALGQYRLHVAYAAVLLVAGCLLAWLLSRPVLPIKITNIWLTKTDLAIAISCGVFAFVFYGTYLLNQGFWVGAGDFTKDAVYLRPAAQALEAARWPIWSHATCGGMALLGNPEGNTFSLGTLFATFLPIDQAFLLLLVVEAALAATGTYLLARALRLGVWGSLIAVIVAILSPTYAYRIVEGLTPIGGAVAFCPWVLLGVVRGLHPQNPVSKWWGVFSGLCLGAVLLRGEVHVITGIILVVTVWCLLTAVRRRQLQPLLLLIIIGIVTFLIGSIKILPYLEQPILINRDVLRPYAAILSRENQYQKVFLRLYTRQERLQVLHGETEAFGNFGAYLGILPFVLAGVGLWQKKTYRWELIATTILIFAVSEGTIFDLYIRHVPGLDMLMRVPTRFLSIFVVLLGLLAGRGIDRLLFIPRPGWRYIPLIAISIALFLDLGLSTGEVFKQNLQWDHNPLSLYPDRPILMPHQNDSPQQMYHPTKLARAGYLLPHICADQNNPANFIKDLKEPTPIAEVPVTLTPNQIALSVMPQNTAQDLTLNERFVSSWVTDQAELLENDDGSIHMILPASGTDKIVMSYKGATTATQKVLFILFIVLITSLLLIYKDTHINVTFDKK